MRMSSAQLAALFEGLDWRLVRPEQARVRWRQDERADLREGHAFTGQVWGSVIHSVAWMPTLPAARMPI